MSSREEDVKAILIADPLLVSLLTGGIYTDQEIGIEGIHRGEDSNTDAAFDEMGILKPCCIIRQSALIPRSEGRIQKEKKVLANRPLFIIYYQHRGMDILQPAIQRGFELLEGERLKKSYPLIWEGESPFLYDVGPVANATTVKQDWNIVEIRSPVGAP